MSPWRHWRDFENIQEKSEKSVFPSDAEALENDAGRCIGFVRAVAKCIGSAGLNPYDPAAAMHVGVDG